jgi:hypothetical protein
MSKDIRKMIDKVKNFNQFINENSSTDIDVLIQTIESYSKKIKINKPHILYDNGLETAISNSEITKFYTKFQRENFKKYIKSIPFPFDKIGDNGSRFDKLNDIARIFENYDDVRLNLVKHMCLHMMDIILYDMYFGVKSMGYDIYEKIDELVIPDKNNDFECKKFGLWFTDKENPMNYILFYTNTNEIIRRIENY